MEMKDIQKLGEELIQDEEKTKLGKTYENIQEILKEFCDLHEDDYILIPIWCIGAIHIDCFTTYPYLFINAMRGSGKTRLLKLIASICGGRVLNSLTEAVLFRTRGCLAIDEFEGIGRKGNENLRELLNSAYKKGIKVLRMKKVKTITGEEQQVEEFEVFRPITIANIWGMEEVLGDRCINIVLDKSNNPLITKKIENFEEIIEKCRLCRVVSMFNVYKDTQNGWNTYLNEKYKDTHNTNNTTTQTTLTTLILSFYNKIDESGLDGRILELSFPLLFIGWYLNDKIFDDLVKIFKKMDEHRKEEDITDNIDISLIDYVSQLLEDKWLFSKELLNDFKKSIQNEDEWINEKWLGRALKRLNLIKQKKRMNYGRMYMLDIIKAQEKIRMFK